MKLQTFLAHAGVASRRKSEELILSGRVHVNGEGAKIGARVCENDVIEVDGKKISLVSDQQTFLMYKPVGIVSTTSDELGRKTVIDFLHDIAPETKKISRLYPVGRLDRDSEGLMILTNDGELAQRFTHPSFEVEKTYQVTVNGSPTEKALAHLARGVLLKEGMTAPAKVHVTERDVEQTVLEVTIHEGRYHQVKRMLLRVGYEVTKLVRTAMGPYSLADLHGHQYQKVK